MYLTDRIHHFYIFFIKVKKLISRHKSVLLIVMDIFTILWRFWKVPGISCMGVEDLQRNLFCVLMPIFSFE